MFIISIRKHRTRRLGADDTGKTRGKTMRTLVKIESVNGKEMIYPVENEFSNTHLALTNHKTLTRREIVAYGRLGVEFYTEETKSL